MTHIRFQGQRYEVAPDESVLACLQRQGINVPSSCRSGVCQCCLMQAVQGEPPATSQRDLKSTLKAQGYFLACVCQPTVDLDIRLPDADLVPIVRCHVVDKTLLAPNIVRLRLQSKENFGYKAGQFLSLMREDGLTRSYSIASIPTTDNTLDLHIQRLPGGRMSEWIHRDVAIGTAVDIKGPKGQSFYLPGNTEQPLVLIGTGSGLAPLVGIIQDALLQNHRGPIHLIHGSRTRDGLYFIDELRNLSREHLNFQYSPCVSGVAEPGFPNKRADDYALDYYSSFKGIRAFLCGHPEMVYRMKKQIFLRGGSLKEIYADPFIITNAA